MAEPTVVVVGGGLAGIAAALRAADRGCAVTLLESRPRLGGAAFSFRRGELTVDNGQHVFLRCCAAYRWFLDRVGGTELTTLQDRLDIPVLAPGGRSGRLRRTSGVPAPAHLTAALAGYRLLSVADRARAVRGAVALRLLNPADPSLDRRTLGEYLRRHGQNDATIAALWGIVATATLNLGPDDASLALAAKVFRTGLLDSAAAADIGHATAPLGELHSVAAGAALAGAGVAVTLGARVETVGGGPVVRFRADGSVREVRPDAVVLAVPPRELFALAPALSGTAAAPARQLQTAPIVNVHVVYDRPVTDLPFAAGVGTPVQWVFDRTESSGLRRSRPGGQYLAVTVSAADDLIDVPARAIVDRFVAALAELFPRARRAEVLDAFVTRERHATFRQAAGTAPLRPGPDSGLPGVALAGAWTATGWPDTMESAVRSGVAAAQHILGVASSDLVEFAA
ncbi:hydroxysqualene dehydroxylase HpnE [uncultured Jatrophihabitans sp.]|uniref:hydroxysqualene dehydroxylase HpnE n=1 Tax=uncultured Jatrophihabitans sp. TaxID=1610747 RepID=UPI0035CA78E0